MRKGQSLDPKLVIKVWREMLQAYEDAAPPPYPSTRTVAEELARRGFKTYRNTSPTREAVRLVMRESEEGQTLMRQSHDRYLSGGRYAD